MDNNRMILPPLGGEVEIDHFQLIVFIEGGTLTATNSEGRVISAYGSTGTYCFTGLTVGEWTITATLDEETSVSQSVSIIDETATQTIKMYYNVIPEFTYTGSYAIVNDDDKAISKSTGNWKIKFFTSGILTFTDLKQRNMIDIFLVGGGGGGWDSGSTYSWCGGPGGGYTRTLRSIEIEEDGMPYSITIGGGGSVCSNGGQSSAFGYNCAGGYTPPGHTNEAYRYYGGNGGTGGCASGSTSTPTDGNNGYPGSQGGNVYGYGQRNVAGPNGETGTTREFGESTGKVYSNGGYSRWPSVIYTRVNNSGNAGLSMFGTGGPGLAGCSGIVIIRNARATA